MIPASLDDAGQKNILRLIQKGADPDGWARVSKVVWPLIEMMPDDLIDKRPDEAGGGRVRIKDLFL